MRSLFPILTVLLATLTLGCDPTPRASAREITELPDWRKHWRELFGEDPPF